MTTSTAADELNDAAVAAQLRAVLVLLVKNVDTMAPETRSEILNNLVDVLDSLDQEDTFGTEGWRHAAGLAD